VARVVIYQVVVSIEDGDVAFGQAATTLIDTPRPISLLMTPCLLWFIDIDVYSQLDTKES
jgi:hypothetical protein